MNTNDEARQTHQRHGTSPGGGRYSQANKRWHSGNYSPTEDHPDPGQYAPLTPSQLAAPLPDHYIVRTDPGAFHGCYVGQRGPAGETTWTETIARAQMFTRQDAMTKAARIGGCKVYRREPERTTP